MMDLTGVKPGDTIKIWAYRNGERLPSVSKGRVVTIRDLTKQNLSKQSILKNKVPRSRYLLTVQQGETFRSYYTEFLFGRKVRWYEKFFFWRLFTNAR
jgi:hypothetical protein